MSKEYIERSAVITALKGLPFQWDVEDLAVYEAIEEVPAADVAPVVHGEWIHKNGEMYCSVCGSEALMDEVYYKSPYCPDCGAKMRGVAAND